MVNQRNMYQPSAECPVGGPWREPLQETRDAALRAQATAENVRLMAEHVSDQISVQGRHIEKLDNRVGAVEVAMASMRADIRDVPNKVFLKFLAVFVPAMMVVTTGLAVIIIQGR